MREPLPAGDWRPTNLTNLKAIAGAVMAAGASASLWFTPLSWLAVAALILSAWALWEIAASGFRQRGFLLAVLGLLFALAPLVAEQAGWGERYLRPAPSTAERLQRELELLDERITRWETQQERLGAARERLAEDKRTLVGRIREMGIGSPDDLAGRPRAQPLVEELVELERQLRQVDTRWMERETALERLRAGRRRLERRGELAAAEFSEEEIVELLQTAAEVESSLEEEAPPSPVELEIDRVLEDSLSADP